MRLLPPLPRRGAAHDDLSPAQRRLMVGGITAAHVVALWALLQVQAVREAVLQAAPMFVSLVQPEAAKPPEPPPPPPPAPRPLPKTPLPPPVIAAAPTPAPVPAFTVPAPPPEPAPPAPAPAVVAPPSPAPAPPAPPVAPPAPRILPASAVQFAEPPVVDYPRTSRRSREQGTVIVRAWIDAQGGASRNVQVEKSSGFARLDEAAVQAVQRARFKPYTENGRAAEGWALVPIQFELEK